MLTYNVNVAGPLAMVDGIAVSARDSSRILKRWGGYFKSQALKRADAADGWPGLAESTRKKYEQTRKSSVTAAGRVRKSYGGALEGYLRRQERKGDATAGSDLAELRRLRAGGRVSGSAGPYGSAVTRLRSKLERAEKQRAKGRRATVGGNKRKGVGKLLGRVARQIQWDVAGNLTKTYARAPWSGIHNDGGTAGHGAVIPARPFLLIDQRDMTTLSLIAVDHMMRGSR